MSRTLLLPLALLVACTDADKVPEQQDTVDTSPPELMDEDGDGYYTDEDCDDDDAQTHPGATELCDSVDNDCDAEIDEGVERTWYVDADGDGFGDDANTTSACSAPEGTVPNGNDCDDADDSAYPGGNETCDGVDNDCNGEIDEDGNSTWYVDDDGDGYGDPELSREACEQPEGYVANGDDCDDALVDVNPDGAEACNGYDDDCDGETDEDGAADFTTYYQDRDEDGYGDPARTAESCAAPDGYVEDNTDCDDLSADSYPGATEICDDADNDCDGDTDEDGLGGPSWYADEDEDGYGDPATALSACEAPDGWTLDFEDCDDTDAGVHPGADETCDEVDQDCDGETDESATDALAWYEDDDDDGYGDVDALTLSCEAPAGHVSDRTDCDDADDAINPAADEICDAVDNDCDGETDEDSAADAATWYADYDGDGYGDPDRATAACEAPADYVDDDTDCDDSDADSHPGGVEVCDDANNDCDDRTDEGAIDAGTWYTDADDDGFGDRDDSGTRACDAPAGMVDDDTDCDDACDTCYPGSTEVCDGSDNDCDESVDEAGAFGESSFYPDGDGDGYGEIGGVAVEGCDAPSGYATDDTDCDDADADINPGETETCDGTDNDCSGDEVGIVTFTNSGGTKSDVSSTWGAGSSDSAASLTLSSSGTYAICPGTYYVSVTSSGTTVTLNGPYGSDETILSGGGSKRTAYTTKALTLSGLTLEDGYTSTGYGGNLYSTGTLSLSDVVLQRGSSSRGGNLYVGGGTATLDAVEIKGGSATSGGGVYVTAATLDGDTVFLEDNEATNGGGLYLSGSSAEVTLADSLVSGGNATTSGGGAYLVSGGTLTVTGTEITENSAGSYGGGVYLSASSFAMSSGSNVDGNTSSLLGGGLYLTGGADVSCSGSSSTTAGVWGNTALLGGGAYMSTSDTISSTTCDWTGTTDNTLYDIVIVIYYYTKGNNATFTCTGSGC